MIRGATIVLLSLCLLSPCSAAPQVTDAIQTHDVPFGDVVVHALGPTPKRPRPIEEYFGIDVLRDPRFIYPRPLTGLFLSIHANNGNRLELTSVFNGVVEKFKPDHALYAAPATMTVYPHPRSPLSAVVRLDGTTFLGREAYMLCDRLPVTFRGRKPHHCRIETELTDRISVDVVFFDDLFPPDEWPAMLKSVDDGIRRMVTIVK